MYSFVHTSFFHGSPTKPRTRGPHPNAVSRAHSPPTATAQPGAALTRRAFTFSALALATGGLLAPATLAQGLPTRPPTATERARQLRQLVAKAIAQDPTIAATLLRLAFHDSFTRDVVTGRGGANGSIRLETGRGENFGLARAVTVLKPLQEICALSWGDVVAIAGAQAVESTGGPHIDVRLGRDNASVEDPRDILPKPDLVVSELRDLFGPRGFNDRDLVALSGAHTLGRVGGGGPFVAEPNKFKNDYFLNLLWYQDRRENNYSEKVGPPDKPNFQLPSDVHLLDDASTLAIVREFGADQNAFFDQFAKSYNKMVNVGTPFAARP